MLYFDRIDVSEGGGVNKTNASKESYLSLLVFPKLYSFKFQSIVCNICHDLLMVSMNLCDIPNLNIKVSDYHCIISLISKNKAINLMENADFTEKRKPL